MTPQRTKIYLQAMERIKARERLFLMDATQYPHLQLKTKKQGIKSFIVRHIQKTLRKEQ